MGGAISIFVLLSLSVFVIRIASVAMRLTGLDDSSARFQALSAFSGTGFTTKEAEMIVNYPVRRRIVSLLMIIGNLGLVGVLATLVTSLVQTEGEMYAVLRQLAWLLAGLALLWFLLLNETADRLLCRMIDRFLKATTQLGRRRYQRLLQLADGFSVCEHPLETTIETDTLNSLGLKVLAVRDHDGNVQTMQSDTICPDDGGWLIAFGDDTGHETLAERALQWEPATTSHY
ncbi:MAG: hypothetical protein QNJ73_10020 [Gammaproteobacteria bacterium]|nr:hypothetical protein [Gammaproteobacteria bacterium]